MKICWDNLEKLHYNKDKGKWYNKDGAAYTYGESCKQCGEPFLKRDGKGLFCCRSCSKMGSNNPIYGKHHTEEARRKISENSAIKGGELHPMYGKHHTEEAKRKIGESSKGSKNNLWKGGVTKKNIPLYDTYASQIEWIDEVRRCPENEDIMEVRCTYCGKWFIPKRWGLLRRIQYLKGNISGENRLYCSERCKSVCPLYRKKPETLMREDAVRSGRLSWLKMSREVQHELREMVLERDNHTCRKCGSKDKPLHCHHIEPVAINPIESADMDNCITLCIDCHREAHSKDGCRYGQLRICEEDYESTVN
jgi:5-methylcytosine-specific restriction endonuclease McrA/ribosomal protein L37AE/L43A